MSIRITLEETEQSTLSTHAAMSCKSKRQLAEKECDFRTAFQKDRDKILHAKEFRRLKHKTQVFLSPLGDHYRTRMTHSFEVMQIGRTIARALRLNEDLVEAAALGHDLGHTPFGHTGEAALNKIYPEGFHHALQSVRIVEKLARDGRGFNLTTEVKEAIQKHSKGKGPIITDNPNLKASTLEGQIVRLSDVLAYVNHDLDDSIRAGLLTGKEVPKTIQEVFGKSHSQRIQTMVKDVVDATQLANMKIITMSQEKLDALKEFRAFMFENVYETEVNKREMDRAKAVVESLYAYYVKNPDQLLAQMSISEFTQPIERHAVDFVAGMTDRFAIKKYSELYLPRPWSFI